MYRIRRVTKQEPTSLVYKVTYQRRWGCPARLPKYVSFSRNPELSNSHFRVVPKINEYYFDINHMEFSNCQA